MGDLVARAYRSPRATRSAMRSRSSSGERARRTRNVLTAKLITSAALMNAAIAGCPDASAAAVPATAMRRFAPRSFQTSGTRRTRSYVMRHPAPWLEGRAPVAGVSWSAAIGEVMGVLRADGVRGLRSRDEDPCEKLRRLDRVTCRQSPDSCAAIPAQRVG